MTVINRNATFGSWSGITVTSMVSKFPESGWKDSYETQDTVFVGHLPDDYEKLPGARIIVKDDKTLILSKEDWKAIIEAEGAEAIAELLGLS